jgi:hypothetical protein
MGLGSEVQGGVPAHWATLTFSNLLKQKIKHLQKKKKN